MTYEDDEINEDVPYCDACGSQNLTSKRYDGDGFECETVLVCKMCDHEML